MPNTAFPLTLLFVVLIAAGCSSGSDTNSDAASINPDAASEYTATGAPADPSFGASADPSFGDDYRAPSASSQSASMRVAILDHGLRMTRGTQVIPRDWKLMQDIATDPNTGQIIRYVFDARGPSGELVLGMGIANYTSVLGTSLEQSWRELAIRGLRQEVQDLSLGNLGRSAYLEQLDSFRKGAQKVAQRGLEVHGLEAPFRGNRQGQPVEGVVYVYHYGSSQMPGSGTIQVSALMSSPDLLENTLRLNAQMANSYQPNPQFEQVMEEIGRNAIQRQQSRDQQRMANSRTLHQQRMADNQARFQSHQQMMNDQYSANDKQHQQWMDNFKNDNSSAWSGSEYSSHNAFIDATHERSTFQDPYSGQQVNRDGNYDNWYTNGQGDYYGTDDPSFDPNSIQGDWQRIEPLQPNP